MSDIEITIPKAQAAEFWANVDSEYPPAPHCRCCGLRHDPVPHGTFVFGCSQEWMNIAQWLRGDYGT